MEEQPKRRSGQHGKYSVKSPGRTAALERYRASHNWSEEASKLWTEERKKKQSKEATERNKKRWQEWDEEKKAQVRANFSKALKGRKMPQSHRDKLRASGIRRAEDPEHVAGVRDLSQERKKAYELAAQKGYPLDWLALKKMDKDAVANIIKYLKALPE